MRNKAQVTIFIIVGIALVVVGGLIFLIRFEKIPFLGEKIEKNPQKFISSCIEDKMKENINLIIPQGGFIEPKNYKIYNDIKVTYLCENRGLFRTCINQHPMFLNEISNELKENIISEIETCFIEFKESLEKEGYEAEIGNDMNVDVSLGPGNVYLDIARDIIITKSGETSRFEKIRLYYKSSLYELASIASNIAEGESQFCNFEYLGYMNLHPNYLIQLKVMSDSTKIYSIKDKKTNEEMNIAIRGCVVI